jgi:hypothetical protein
VLGERAALSPAPLAPAAPARLAPAPAALPPLAAAPPELEAPEPEPPEVVEEELPPRAVPREVAVAEPPPRRPAPAPRRAPPRAQDLVIPSLVVAGTVWHPDAGRRLARVQVAGREGEVELREGDAVGSLVVSAIEPSGVVFLLGDMEVRLRVGEDAAARD